MIRPRIDGAITPRDMMAILIAIIVASALGGAVGWLG